MSLRKAIRVNMGDYTIVVSCASEKDAATYDELANRNTSLPSDIVKAIMAKGERGAVDAAGRFYRKLLKETA